MKIKSVILFCILVSMLGITACGEKKDDMLTPSSTEESETKMQETQMQETQMQETQMQETQMQETQTQETQTQRTESVDLTKDNDDVYAQILLQYQNAAVNDYYLDELDDYHKWRELIGEYVAEEYVANHDEPIYYAKYDVDGNGVEELLLAVLYEGNIPIYYDIYSSDGEKPVSIFDMNFGYRTNLNVYADGTLEVNGSLSAAESFADFYLLDENGVPSMIESFYQKGEYVGDEVVMSYSKTQNGEESTLTETEFYDQLGVLQNAAIPELNWIKIDSEN